MDQIDLQNEKITLVATPESESAQDTVGAVSTKQEKGAPVPGLSQSDDEIFLNAATDAASTDRASSNRRHPGLRRHKAIVAICSITAAAFLALTWCDPKTLISHDAQIDTQMRVTAIKPPPVLPGNLHYDTYNRYSDTEAEPVFHEGLTPVWEMTWQGKRYGYVGENGRVIIPPKFEEVRRFSDGLASVRLPEPKTASSGRNKSSESKQPEKWGFIDTNGQMVIPAKFGYPAEFNNGVAVIEQEENYSLINKTGKILKNFGSSAEKCDNAYLVKNETTGRFGLMGPDLEWLFPPEYEVFELRGYGGGVYTKFKPKNEGDPIGEEEEAAAIAQKKNPSLLHIYKNGKAGIADSTGKILIPTIFDQVFNYSNGHAIVSLNNQLRFADSVGHLMPLSFTVATPFDACIAYKTKQSKKWTFADSSGKRLSTLKVDGVISDEMYGQWLFNRRGAIIKNGKCGFVNEQGQLVIPPKYDFARPFRHGYAQVFENNRWKYIDTNGKVVSQPFAKTAYFDHGTAQVEVAGPLYDIANSYHTKETRESHKEQIERLTDVKYCRWR